VLVALILAVGIGGTVVALKSREGNPQFVLAQQNLTPVGSAALQTLLLTTSDSRPGYSGRALQVHCSSPLHTALGNPWTCVVRYPRPPHVRFRVIVHGDRSIYGVGQPEGGSRQVVLTVKALSIRGCCVGAS
jgi:hypothetical protein